MLRWVGSIRSAWLADRRKYSLLRGKSLGLHLQNAVTRTISTQHLWIIWKAAREEHTVDLPFLNGSTGPNLFLSTAHEVHSGFEYDRKRDIGFSMLWAADSSSISFAAEAILEPWIPIFRHTCLAPDCLLRFSHFRLPCVDCSSPKRPTFVYNWSLVPIGFTRPE